MTGLAFNNQRNRTAMMSEVQRSVHTNRVSCPWEALCQVSRS
jgi:hypothetical protein